MQTVRASFSVPGRGGVASVEENDPFQPDSEENRMGRGQRLMKYVDKSALVLKEEDDDAVADLSIAAKSSEESEALVKEIKEAHNSTQQQTAMADDVQNTVAMLENIVPGLNEQDIKHAATAESVVPEAQTAALIDATPDVNYAKYAMLLHEHMTAAASAESDELTAKENGYESRGNN